MSARWDVRDNCHFQWQHLYCITDTSPFSLYISIELKSYYCKWILMQTIILPWDLPSIFFWILKYCLFFKHCSHQIKLVTKALHPKPLLQLHHFDKVAPIVSCYSNQLLFVKLPVCKGILQDFSCILCNVILWKIAGLDKQSSSFSLQWDVLSNSACMSSCQLEMSHFIFLAVLLL